MANKKQANKAHRKENRIERKAAKTQRQKTLQEPNGFGQLVNSIQKRNELEDVNEAAARIVGEAEESDESN